MEKLKKNNGMALIALIAIVLAIIIIVGVIITFLVIKFKDDNHEDIGNNQIWSDDPYATNIFATLYEDGTLTFSTTEQDGNGIVFQENIRNKTFGASILPPWYQYRRNITSVNVIDQIVPTNTDYWFYDCRYITSINLEKMSTNRVVSMSNMFYGCSGLTDLILGEFNTNSVVNMMGMFYNCSSLTNLDVIWSRSSRK